MLDRYNKAPPQPPKPLRPSPVCCRSENVEEMAGDTLWQPPPNPCEQPGGQNLSEYPFGAPFRRHFLIDFGRSAQAAANTCVGVRTPLQAARAMLVSTDGLRPCATVLCGAGGPSSITAPLAACCGACSRRQRPGGGAARSSPCSSLTGGAASQRKRRAAIQWLPVAAAQAAAAAAAAAALGACHRLMLPALHPASHPSTLPTC